MGAALSDFLGVRQSGDATGIVSTDYGGIGCQIPESAE